MPMHGAGEFEEGGVPLCVQYEGREEDVEGESQKQGTRSKSCGGNSGSGRQVRCNLNLSVSIDFALAGCDVMILHLGTDYGGSAQINR